jgi:hypothetical protein
LYADSEGGAALLATGLPELLQLIRVAPWCGDRASFTADEPDLETSRDRVAELLGLDLPSEQAAIARVHEVAPGIGKDFTLIFTPEGTAYRQLITAPARADS